MSKTKAQLELENEALWELIAEIHTCVSREHIDALRASGEISACAYACVTGEVRFLSSPESIEHKFIMSGL